MSEENEKDQVYQVDTVPPPDGEADAYNAPTRVGQMAASTIAEMLIHAGLDESAALDKPPVEARAPAPVATAAPMFSSELPRMSENLNSSIPPSMPPTPPTPSLAAALGMSEPSATSGEEDVRGSLVPRLNEPEEDDDDPDLALAAEPAVASFQPLPLTPAVRPVFSGLQKAIIAIVIVLASVGIYLLFR